MIYDTILSIATRYLKASLRNSFNLAEFKRLAPEKAYDYVAGTLPVISAGSSRIAYILSGTKVLKLALNEKGIAQNETEYMISQKYSDTGLTTKVYDTDSLSYWLISELVRPATSGDFESMLGISFYDFEKLIDGNSDKEFDELEESSKQFLRNVLDLKLENRLADVDELNSWGKTGDGRLVLLDVGADHDVISHYYRNSAFNDYKPFYDNINPAIAFDKIKSAVENGLRLEDAEITYLSNSLIKNETLAAKFLELKEANPSYFGLSEINSWHKLLFGKDYEEKEYNDS